MYVYADGRRFEGEYANDSRNGYGVEWDAQGGVTEAGLWANGKITQSLMR